MTNDMFGINACRYAALTGRMHGGTCNPARWAGLRNAAPLALRDRMNLTLWAGRRHIAMWGLGDNLQPHTVGWAEEYHSWNVRSRKGSGMD